MEGAITIADVLRLGVQREMESQHLYADLVRKMTEPAARFAFSTLLQQEQRHQEILENYLAGGIGEGALEIGTIIDYHIAQHMEKPVVTAEMSLPDIFLLAANREKQANEFYSSLAAAHPPGQTRRLMEKLASEELGHKLKVETIYTEVAFPQTDGG
jgi:rubrerythrin